MRLFSTFNFRIIKCVFHYELNLHIIPKSELFITKIKIKVTDGQSNKPTVQNLIFFIAFILIKSTPHKRYPFPFSINTAKSRHVTEDDICLWLQPGNPLDHDLDNSRSGVFPCNLH